MTTPTLNFCPNCGSKLPAQSKFCPQCGSQLNPASAGTQNGGLSSTVAAASTTHDANSLVPSAKAGLTSKHYLAVLLLAVAIWFPAWMIQEWKAGVKPTKPFEQTTAIQSTPTLEQDPGLQAVFTAAKNAPDNLEAQQSLAAALVQKIRETETPSNDLIFSAMEALAGVLRLKPDEPNALIAMADISFNQQVFSKASEYYARYLALQPRDHDARARYASSLSFGAKFDDAIKELKAVLKEDPKNFHASAYLAITYAQMGKKADALSAAEVALPLAPNDEARARFSNFVQEVKKGAKDAKPAVQESAAPSLDSSKDTQSISRSTALAATAGNAVEVISSFIKGNSVAGRKFVEAKETTPGTVALYFKEFPMEGMPEYVRNKFVNSIKLKALDLGVQTLSFVDQDTGTEMVRAQVKGNS
jgi:tetratricopeptide (TPR) repeat protein